MNFEITYCMAWNYKPDADRVLAEIKNKTGQEPSLIPGSGGVFDVTQDGKLLFSKHQLGRFPETGEIAGLIES